jgi:membrane-associated phospholipid phosphatase
VQDALWQSYKTGTGDIRGISAMPSMHVMIATLLALFGWRTNRTLGIGLSIFAILIVLGSVHLLWHYAVDTIAGAAIAWLCWVVAGIAARRWLFYIQTRGTDRNREMAQASRPA